MQTSTTITSMIVKNPTEVLEQAYEDIDHIIANLTIEVREQIKNLDKFGNIEQIEILSGHAVALDAAQTLRHLFIQIKENLNPTKTWEPKDE